MLELISLVALLIGFSLMTYENYKEGHMLMTIFGAFVVGINIIDIVKIIVGGKF
ncbi:hypothetical protein P4159_05615 [Bacillus thuringiensis]|uniref:hypothetical protein n=1 Tax=Bacillus cereus group TaxID=86661 RepID=UPI001559AAD1|nr:MULTISPECIES: hypothetical protein [Bacillus cereus group]MEC3420521.1 hypothetical protein [Bacillus cereus]MEC3596931.1 hypothetical protein [Bacillus thuringiensis]MED1574280.1 hypothetical protein [Bacillus paranthracis]MED1836204.1 hypothetical protein [Bacillus thuringiensis]MED2670267.1 hypothetical protein [Bacillus thuringiensis]